VFPGALKVPVVGTVDWAEKGLGWVTVAAEEFGCDICLNPETPKPDCPKTCCWVPNADAVCELLPKVEVVVGVFEKEDRPKAGWPKAGVDTTGVEVTPNAG
jgi:hypothetical protein